ncbi:MAG: purine-binding chemotaxis protein CheW [Clostridiales bacterium]|nr:purine-binding chemotaxis protein CheW [Clostridiales bacterium]
MRLDEQAKQFIVTTIGNEQYGINIQYIESIVKMEKITRVPKVQNYYKGVINLRGEIIPVMSLRLRFELEEIETTASTRIIILKPDKQNPMGIIVDSVREVVTLTAEEMEKPNIDNQEERTLYVSSIGKHDGELISILNIGSLVIEKE